MLHAASSFLRPSVTSRASQPASLSLAHIEPFWTNSTERCQAVSLKQHNKLVLAPESSRVRHRVQNLSDAVRFAAVQLQQSSLKYPPATHFIPTQKRLKSKQQTSVAKVEPLNYNHTTTMSEDLSAYQQCVADGSSGDALVECIANGLEQVSWHQMISFGAERTCQSNRLFFAVSIGIGIGTTCPYLTHNQPPLMSHKCTVNRRCRQRHRLVLSNLCWVS